MSDTTYNVFVKYNLDTKESESGLDRLKSSLGDLKSLAMTALVGWGLEKLVKGFVDLNSEVENTRIQLAGMMQAGAAPGTKDFNDALRMSNVLIDDMRIKSAAIPGTWQDLATIMRGITIPGLDSGKSMNQLTDLAMKAQTLFLPQGFDADHIGRTMASMMQGHARAMDPIVRQLQAVMDLNGKAFKDLDATERYAAIEKALQKFDPAMQAFKGSWLAVETTTKNYLQLFEEKFSSAAFDELKKALSGVNDWFQANKKAIDEFAESAGKKLADGLVKAFDAVKKAIEWVVDHKDTIINIAEKVAMFMGARAIGTGLYNLGGGGAAGSFGSVLGGAGGAVAMSALQGHTDAASLALRTFEGALSGLPGKMGAVGTALVLLHSALQAAADYIDKQHGKQLDAEAERGRVMSKLQLETKQGDSAAVLGGVSAQLRDLGIMSKDLKLDMTALGQYLQKSNVTGEDAYRFGALALKSVEYQRSITQFGPVGPSQADLDRMKLDEARAPKRNAPTNINVRIEQTIEDATDPERILIKTKEALDQALIHPIETGYHPLSTLR